ncbi:MAG: glycosyltransferase [Anaerolineae bacterium]
MPNPYPDVGMIVPVWYPTSAKPSLVQTLIERTLEGVDRYCLPEHVLLVQDGQENWREAVAAQAEAHGFGHLFLPENLGKGKAIAAGFEAMEGRPLRFLAVRDSDGDHLANDLPALVDLADQIETEADNSLTIVSGGRVDRYRPLGLERALFEELTDRVLWQALQYHAAREGRVLSGAYFAPYGDWPDIQSGYKVYSVAAARVAGAVLASADRGGDGSLSRCGVETLPAVTVLSLGGEFGVVMRRTYQEQPVSGYRDMDPLRLYGEPLLWAFRRLQVSGSVAATLLDDALLRSPLLFDATRRERALAVRRLVLEGLGAEVAMRLGARFF